jgi:hypothetical protein
MKGRIILGSLAVSALLCTTAMAQPGGGGGFTPPTPESRVEALNTAVTLTADQKAKVLKYYTDLQNNAGQGGGGMGMGRGMMGGGALPADLQKILTADQVKKYDAYTLQQSVDRRMTQIDTAVTLTADQKKKLQPILEKEITATNKLNASITMDPNGDMQAQMQERQTKMAPITAETTKALQTILTKEQLTKYEAMPQRGGMGGFGGGGMGGGRGN